MAPSSPTPIQMIINASKKTPKFLYAMEYSRKYSGDVKDTALTHCLTQMQESRVFPRSGDFLKEALLP